MHLENANACVAAVFGDAEAVDAVGGGCDPPQPATSAAMAAIAMAARAPAAPCDRLVSGIHMTVSSHAGNIGEEAVLGHRWCHLGHGGCDLAVTIYPAHSVGAGVT
jgi:hypothetical protein